MDKIKEILDWIVACWDKINVWLPATLVPVILIIYKVIKVIAKIWQSRKEIQEKTIVEESLLVNKTIDKMKEQMNKQKEVLENILALFSSVIQTQINPKVREDLKSQLEGLFTEVANNLIEQEKSTDEKKDSTSSKDDELKGKEANEQTEESENGDNNSKEEKKPIYTGE